MRIISGIYKGRKIYAPKNLPVRPTTDQAKEALFNIISNIFQLSEISILDLFSGTGNLSYEFSSRGVKDITCVDFNIKCINFIKSVSIKLSLNIKVIKSDVFKFLNKNITNYNIIFADPPYDFEQMNYEKIIQLIIYKQLLQDEGLIIIEHSKKTNLKDIQNYYETRVYGGCCFSFFKI
tara:strand:- start:1968 stop:2504 length:537 start_codon:yes stop_codon:yes gene_type:complete